MFVLLIILGRVVERRVDTVAVIEEVVGVDVEGIELVVGRKGL